MLVYVRPSNEALLGSSPSPEGVDKPSFTARIERPPLYRGGTASKKDGCLLPRILLSVRVLRARRAPGHSLPLLRSPRLERAQEIVMPLEGVNLSCGVKSIREVRLTAGMERDRVTLCEYMLIAPFRCWPAHSLCSFLR